MAVLTRKAGKPPESESVTSETVIVSAPTPAPPADRAAALANYRRVESDPVGAAKRAELARLKAERAKLATLEAIDKEIKAIEDYIRYKHSYRFADEKKAAAAAVVALTPPEVAAVIHAVEVMLQDVANLKRAHHTQPAALKKPGEGARLDRKEAQLQPLLGRANKLRYLDDPTNELEEIRKQLGGLE